jgi:type VI secretion system secreted protein Hcp
MAVDMFLLLDKIEGETQDNKFTKGDSGLPRAIDVLSWSWGMSNPATGHTGGGSGTGKVNVHDVSVTKYIDASSAALAQYCATGEHIAKGKLVVRKAGGTALEYLTFDMEQIFITGITTGGSAGEDRLTENISLNFSKIKKTYATQKADGTKDKEKEFTYDVAKNVKV